MSTYALLFYHCPTCSGDDASGLIVPEEHCRCNARLQKNAQGLSASYIKRAQRVLMSKMGICEIEDEAPVDCLQKYTQLFQSPLLPHRIDTLARLLSLDIPFEETSLSLEFCNARIIRLQ